MFMVKLSELELRAYLNLDSKPPAEDTARGSHRTAFTQILFGSLQDGVSLQITLFKVVHFCILSVPGCQKGGREATASGRDLFNLC